MFLVEQNARATLALAHYGYPIQNGESAGGGGAQPRGADLVPHAYLTA